MRRRVNGIAVVLLDLFVKHLILIIFECARTVRNAHGFADSKQLRAESETVGKQENGVAARGENEAQRGVWRLASC